MDGRMSRMSQCTFCARRLEVERDVGRIIHLITREIMIGSREVLESIVRNSGMEVLSERR